MAAPRTETWRYQLHEVVFEADTPAGKAFDVALLCAIVASVTVVMLDSVASIREQYGRQLDAAEWGYTALFTLEYGARLVSIGRPSRYALSFFGIVDLIAVLPTYLSLVIVGAESLLVIRVFRLLRIFRVLKLRRYLAEAGVLEQALAHPSKADRSLSQPETGWRKMRGVAQGDGLAQRLTTGGWAR